MANNEPINSLPEYEIRTMKNDLDKLEGKITETNPEKLVLPKIEPPKPIPTPTPILAPTLPLPPKPIPPTPIKEIKEIEKAPLPKIEEFIAPVPPKIRKPINLKKIFIPIIIILAIIAIGIFFYWQGKLEERQQELPPTQQPEETQISEPLFAIDETKTIEIRNNTSLLSLLKIEGNASQPDGIFKRIVPMKNEKEILSLNELIQELRIAIYPYVLPELKDKYTLVFYSQNNKKRLGLVIETINTVNLKEQLRFWEKTMSDDLKNLFLNDVPGTPTSKEFHDNIYKEVSIRYINFPNPELTIDYAISNNLLILSVSKDSMYRIIDRL